MITLQGHSLRSILALLLLLIVFTMTAAAEDYTYAKGMKSLDFQIQSNGTGPTPGGFEFAWSRFLGENTAVRFGASVTSTYSTSTLDTYRETYDTIDVDLESSRFSGSISFSPQLVFYPLHGKRVQLSTGIGPLVRYSWAVQKSEEQHMEGVPDDITYDFNHNRDSNSRTFTAGALVSLGAHYFLAENFALSAWWGSQFSFYQQNSKANESYNYFNPTRTDDRTNEDGSTFEATYESTLVGVGLTFYY